MSFSFPSSAFVGPRLPTVELPIEAPSFMPTFNDVDEPDADADIEETDGDDDPEAFGDSLFGD